MQVIFTFPFSVLSFLTVLPFSWLRSSRFLGRQLTVRWLAAAAPQRQRGDRPTATRRTPRATPTGDETHSRTNKR